MKRCPTCWWLWASCMLTNTRATLTFHFLLPHCDVTVRTFILFHTWTLLQDLWHHEHCETIRLQCEADGEMSVLLLMCWLPVSWFLTVSSFDIFDLKHFSSCAVGLFSVSTTKRFKRRSVFWHRVFLFSVKQTNLVLKSCTDVSLPVSVQSESRTRGDMGWEQSPTILCFTFTETLPSNQVQFIVLCDVIKLAVQPIRCELTVNYKDQSAPSSLLSVNVQANRETCHILSWWPHFRWAEPLWNR